MEDEGQSGEEYAAGKGRSPALDRLCEVWLRRAMVG